MDQFTLESDLRHFYIGRDHFTATPARMEMSAGISHLAGRRDELLKLTADPTWQGHESEDEVVADFLSIEDAIGLTPAETLGDVAAKLRTSFGQFQRRHTDELPPCSEDMRALANAVHDLERLIRH